MQKNTVYKNHYISYHIYEDNNDAGFVQVKTKQGKILSKLNFMFNLNDKKAIFVETDFGSCQIANRIAIDCLEDWADTLGRTKITMQTSKKQDNDLLVKWGYNMDCSYPYGYRLLKDISKIAIGDGLSK